MTEISSEHFGSLTIDLSKIVNCLPPEPLSVNTYTCPTPPSHKHTHANTIFHPKLGFPTKYMGCNEVFT